MINERELLHSETFRFEHIKIEVLSKTDQGGVIVFGGEYSTASTFKDRFSDGVIEANLTLWNNESTKRPKGYVIVDTFDLPNNKTVCIFIDRRWFFDKWDHEQQDKKIEGYKQFYLDREQQKTEPIAVG